MMNSANEISHHTKLYGFIGEHAAQSSISATLNKLFKAKNKDAMMIPMNIRKDDFYYTAANMKKSHVNGALISNEYTEDIVEILDEASEAVLKSGMCDIVLRDGQQLIGDILGIDVLVQFLKNKNCKKIALIGVDSRAKAFCFLESDFEISYFYDNLENLMNFTIEMGVINPDINRISESVNIDFSNYDAVVDFSDLESLSMVDKLSGLNLDMKQKKEFSALKLRADELEAEYIGFDAMLKELSSAVFKFLEKKQHLEHDKSNMRF